jgi:DNA-binding winged helix-turn-helix (wHTH) protein
MARNLKESSINPEDLMHSSYREHVVKYLVGLVSVQESVVVIAERGYGLSRLLRFITYGHYPVKPLATIQLIYLNMLDFTATSASSFISHLSQYLDKKKKEESLCFVIDELNLDEQTETYFKLLTGFRGKDRTHISFIIGISINTQKDFDIKTPPNYIEDLVGTSIFRLPPLSQSDFFKVAEEMTARFGLIMTRKEIEGLYIKTKGVPSELRFTLQDKFREKFLGETEQTEVTEYQLQLESGHILCGEERIDLELTKAEEGFLKLIIEKRGEVVHRDELGGVLSPESDGTGVSNESIDQLIYRLRKKLVKLGCKEKIETYTGRGYGLMG